MIYNRENISNLIIEQLDKVSFRSFGKIKLLIQKILRGWDDSDIWNLDNNIAKYALPRLRRLRKIGMKSHPSNLSFEDWTLILNEIEWFLEVYSNDDYLYDIERLNKAGELFGKYFGALWD